MSVERIVVVGASAGGIEAVRTLVRSLPATFASTVCVVVHMSPHSPGVLAHILERAAALPVTAARNLERIQPGHVYGASRLPSGDRAWEDRRMATPEKVDIEVRIAKEGNAVEAGLERIALRRGLPAKATA